MAAFSLTKWYLDCVGADGRAAIVYWAALTWRKLQLTWHSLSLYEPDLAPRLRSSLAPVPAPTRLAWSSPALGVRLSCQPLLEPFGRRLLDGVDWHCEAGTGLMRMQFDDQVELQGRGYAERLVLTRVPWRLRLHELEWGRWIDSKGDASLVWITLPGLPTTVYLNGQSAQPELLDCLRLGEPRVLHTRSLGSLLAEIGPLARLVPPAWLAVEERKCLSSGRFQDRTGWAIHERVCFP